MNHLCRCHASSNRREQQVSKASDDLRAVCAVVVS